MGITGKITGIKYQPFLTKKLTDISMCEFDINNAPTSAIIKTNGGHYAISKWVSPKRTRSYPYQRVYETLTSSKKITVIPIIKDEGSAGDRDFLQWDTVSMMSLLDIFVIIAYYDSAEINPRNAKKITNQGYNNSYVIDKIEEIEHYHSSALHWNLKELKESMHDILTLSTSAYEKIGHDLNVKLHNQTGVINFKTRIGKNVEKFMIFSRNKAEEAQNREVMTEQPKEIVSTLSKATVTITNYLGGEYYFTVDEIKVSDNDIELIECKHSSKENIPSDSDIKDGLMKMILYSNLKDVRCNGIPKNSIAVLFLSSKKLNGSLNSRAETDEVIRYCSTNKLSYDYIKILFDEANVNNFTVKIAQV